jgi:hypothetical protein
VPGRQDHSQLAAAQRLRRRLFRVIGAIVEDNTKGVEIAQPRLIGHGTRFRAP